MAAGKWFGGSAKMVTFGRFRFVSELVKVKEDVLSVQAI